MAGRFYTRQHNVGTHIPLKNLYVGMKIHLSHTNFGCYWVIDSIEPENSKGEVWLNLRAPESGKTRRSNAIYAVYIRANEPNNNRNNFYKY